MTLPLPHRWLVFLVFFFAILFSNEYPWAGDINVTASVDKNPATMKDVIALSVTVKGARQSTTPVLPNLPDFKVQNLGTSSSVRIINGLIEASVTHNYQLIPKNEGTFQLGPIKVDIKNQIYQSNLLKLTIKKTSDLGSDAESWAFAKLSVSNSRPFVNEQVVLTFRLYRRNDAKKINLDWSFDPFQKEDLGKGREFPEVVNGIKYLVHEIQVALFGPRVGSFQIGPATVELDLIFQDRRQQRSSPFDHFFSDPFFNRGQRLEHKIFRSNPVTLQVQSLPEKNKPTDFSNLIGQFDIRGSLGKTELEAGDTTTLTIIVSGAGNVQNAEIQAPQLGEGFKVYPDQPRFQKFVSNQKITGQKTFKYALVPLDTGDLTIPSISLSYFDPKTGQYSSSHTQPLVLKVTPSQSTGEIHAVAPMRIQPATPKIELLGRDILPLHTRLEDFKNQAWSQTNKVFYLAGLITPVFLYFGLFFYIRYQRRLREDIAFSRARRAYKQAKQKLDRLSTQSQQDPKVFARKLSQTLREYIGDKLNLQGTAFTSLEVEMKLKKQDYPENQVAETRQLLEKYEALQYGRIGGRPPMELLDESIDVLRKLER